MSPKRRVKSEVRINAYEVISRAVEEGTEMGWNRAHKYIDAAERSTGGASAEAIKNDIAREIMNRLCEVLQFADPYEG
jgi:hypothetical protein